MTPRPARLVTSILLALVLLDLVLATWGFAFPELWFQVWHGAPYVDPQALLPRAAASWAAFCILQFIALVRWRSSPRWLVLVAGVRLADSLTDVTCAFMATDITLAGQVLFPLAGIGNMAVGLLLLRWHRVVTS